MLIRLQDISKYQANRTLYENVNLVIDDNSRVACVGPNGSGKTTLVKIIVGIEEPSSGEVFRTDARFGYMPQGFISEGKETLRELVKRLCGLDRLEAQLQQSAHLLPETLQDILEQYESAGGYTFEYRLHQLLQGFGLEETDSDKSFSSLSQGQQSKVLLISNLLKPGDMLILDEPTNNLDLSAIIWLQEYLKEFNRPLLVISHDIQFLDEVADTIWEINPKKRSISIEHGKVSEFYQRREAEFLAELNEYQLRQEEIKRMRKQATELKAKSERGSRFIGTDNDRVLRGFMRNAAGASARTGRILEEKAEKLNDLPRPKLDKAINLNFGSDSGSSQTAVSEVHGLDFGYGESVIFEDLTLRIEAGEKVLLLGPNGSGKTTLINILSGVVELPDQKVWRNKQYSWFVIDQDQSQLLGFPSSAEFLRSLLGLDISKIYTVLASAGISYEQAKGDPSQLSPGQRVRVMLMAASLFQASVLVLDEPTNHLDRNGYMSLVQALATYQGAAILISHDRQLLSDFNASSSYIISEHQLVRVEDLELYLKSLEQKAHVMIKQIDV